MQWVIGSALYVIAVGGIWWLSFRAGQKGWPIKMSESTQHNTTHSCACGDVHLPPNAEAGVTSGRE